MAHLTKIDGFLFLDLYPDVADFPGGDLYRTHFIPAHTFMIVMEIKPKLKAAFMDLDWLKSFLSKNPAALGHELVDGKVVVTASTEELRSFLGRHAKTEGAFPNPSEFGRASYIEPRP
jgi:hypothetical protein